MSSGAASPGLPATPLVTGHAAERWDERTPADAVAPETAWRHSQRERSVERRFGADECRLHHPTRTLLLRVGNSIVTVLSPAEIPEDVLQALPLTPNP